MGGIGGVFISRYLGYNDGSMQAYLTGAIDCCFGGAVGGMIYQRKGRPAKKVTTLCLTYLAPTLSDIFPNRIKPGREADVPV